MSCDPADETVARTMLTSSADAIVMTDPDGRIRFWGPGAVRIFQLTAEEALGESLDVIIPEPQRERHWEGYRRVMQTGRSRYRPGETLAVPALRKDGTRISVEFTITLAHADDGSIAGAVAVLRDVTERFEEMRALRRRAAGTP